MSPGKVSALDFVTLSFAEGETADLVQSDFSLPLEVLGKRVVWSSSDPSTLRVEAGLAKVTKPALGSKKVILTATAADGSKEFPVTVFSGVCHALPPR